LQATQSEQAVLEQLTRTPYIQILTYPKISLRAARARVTQLRKLCVDTLVFQGTARVGRLGILGLGTVGLVVRCIASGRVCALKIRRTDANRPSLDEEFRLTSFANRLGVGAPMYGHTKDFILMKLVDHVELSEWLRSLEGEGTRRKARDMIHEALNQCRKLDIMGLDHGELSNLRKHAVIAEAKPWLIDFESAGTARKPRNVTTAAQYLFVGGAVAPTMRRAMGLRETQSLKELLGRYKRDQSDYAYSKILEHLKLAPGTK